MEEPRTINECDRCGKKILAKEGEEFVVLRTRHLIFNKEAYTLEFFLCNDCREDFKKWMTRTA